MAEAAGYFRLRLLRFARHDVFLEPFCWKKGTVRFLPRF
jgi:hypothetical protein